MAQVPHDPLEPATRLTPLDFQIPYELLFAIQDSQANSCTLDGIATLLGFQQGRVDEIGNERPPRRIGGCEIGMSLKVPSPNMSVQLGGWTQACQVQTRIKYGGSQFF